MKPGIELIKDIYTQVIRHSLSQPEEIDQVLLKMAAEDLAASTPITSAMKLMETAPCAECENFPVLAGISYGMAQRKFIRRVPDHYLFFSARNK